MNLLEKCGYEATKRPDDRCIVRLKTTFWNDKRGVHMRKSLTVLKRKSSGWNCLQEEIDAVGSEAVTSIVNFNECEDGIYEVVVSNMQRDWESGYVDSWELKLIPYTEGV